jgi:hypothetical protein
MWKPNTIVQEPFEAEGFLYGLPHNFLFRFPHLPAAAIRQVAIEHCNVKQHATRIALGTLADVWSISLHPPFGQDYELLVNDERFQLTLDFGLVDHEQGEGWFDLRQARLNGRLLFREVKLNNFNVYRMLIRQV